MTRLRPSRRIAVLAIVALAVFGGSAAAFFSSSGSGAASASVGTLNASSSVIAAATPGSGTVAISWTASSTVNGIAPQGYYVLRTATSGGTAAACITSPTQLITGTSCHDLAVPDGSFTYKAVARYHSFIATSAVSNEVTVVNDNTAPSVTVEQKAGQADPTNALPIRFTVTFSEPVTGFGAGDLTRGGSSAGGTIAVTGGGASYEIAASGAVTEGSMTFAIAAGLAQDLAGNLNTASASTDNNVTYDTTGPAVTLTSPQNGATINTAMPVLAGSAGDATGDSTTVTVKVYSGAGTGGTVVQTLTATRTGATWTTMAAALLAGTYTVRATQTDTAGNTATSSANTFTIDTAGASVTVNQKASQSDPTGALPILWTVTFSEAVTGFNQADLTRGGTTTGGTVTVSGSGASYEISLTGTPTNGTTTFTIAAAGAQDLAGNNNTASTSTDNGVTYDSVAPATTIATTPSTPDGASSWFKQSSASFTLGATDTTSGVSGRFYTVDGGSTQTYSTAVSVSGQAAHTVTYWSTDAAGNVESANSATIKLDNVAPINALALTGKAGGGSFLFGNALFYQGISAGSFSIQSSVTDATSGPASSAFAALAGTTTGWAVTTSHTKTTPAGGPFASNAFSWGNGTTSAPTEVITSADAAGNSTVSPTLTLTNDSTAPTGGTIGYTDGFFAGSAMPVGLTDGTDAGSGIDGAARFVQRDQVAPTATGVCGIFSNSFAPVTLVGGADTSIVTNMCYRYRYRVSDQVSNQATYTSAFVAKVDNTAPVPASIVAANGNVSRLIDKGTGSGNSDDTLTFTYADAFGVSPGSIVSGWNGSGSQNVSGVVFTDGGAVNDSITVPGLGTVDLGRTTWLTQTSTKAASISNPALNQFVIAITNNPNGNATIAAPSASSFIWTASGTAKDGANNSAIGSATTAGQSF